MPRLKLKIDSLAIILFIILLLQGSTFFSLIILLTALAVHELSHCLTSELLGYRIAEFKLSPLGGRLAIDPLFEINPENELLVALSGPLANWLMVGGVAYLAFLGISGPLLDAWRDYNFLVGFINLLPALPLDGGRIAHAWLNLKMGLEKSLVWSKRGSLLAAILILTHGLAQIYHRRGGLLSLILGFFIITNLFAVKRPRIELIWRLSRRKKSLLAERGRLNLKPVLVTPETAIWKVLRDYGSHDYLLFLVRNNRSEPAVILEDLAWDTIISRGFKATFRDAVKAEEKWPLAE